MTEINLLYTPQKLGPGEVLNVPDTGSVLAELRGIVGATLATGWSVARASMVSDGPKTVWRVTIKQEGRDTSQDVKRVLASAENSRLALAANELPAFGAVLSRTPGTPMPLPLPSRVPAILTVSEVVQRRRAAMMGLLMGLGTSLCLGLLAPAGSAVRPMFDPHTATAGVPTAIVCLFFWGLCMGLQRRRRLRALNEMNGPGLLRTVVDGLSSRGVTAVSEALAQDGVDYSPLLRRVRVALEQWELRPSLQNAGLAVEQQIVADREALQRSYHLLRIFVWAMPVLGLMGTVIGIASAVGGFAGLLATGVDDISKIKAGLVSVTGALSFAFLITLAGLLSSLVLMLVASNMQTREERFYAGVDLSVVENVLPELQRVSPEIDSRPQSLHPNEWSEAMTNAAQGIMHVVDAAGSAMLAKWQEENDSYSLDLANARQSLTQSVRSVASTFEDASVAVATHLAQAAATQERLLDKALGCAKEGFASCGSGIERSAHVVEVSLFSATRAMEEHFEALLQAFDESASAHRSVAQLAVKESSETLAGLTSDLVRATQAVHDLGQLTRRIVESQFELRQGTVGFGEATLADVLRQVDSSLRDLRPLLSNWAQPFVLQAVPLASRGASAGAND